MKKRVRPSKGRGVSLKSAKRKRPAAPRAGRKARAVAVKPRRKRAPAKPRRKPAPVIMKPKRKPALTKGPSVAMLQRRIQDLDEQLRTREKDRTELTRWQEYHRQVQEQVKAKDSAIAFKEKELMDLRRQIEESKAGANRAVEEQRRAREHDRAELTRLQADHRQLQEQGKAKHAALELKEKELMDLRRQLEESRAELKRKEASA